MAIAGFTTQGLKVLKSELDDAAKGAAAPGLVGLVDRDGQTEVLTSGAMSIGGRAMERDSLFRIASMTKLVTATAMMMLVEEGKIKLDEPVARLLPELANRSVLRRIDGPLDDTAPAHRPIMVEDLLTYRLGWGIVFAPPEWPIIKAIADLGIVGFGMPDPTMPFDPDEWMKRLSTLPLMRQPGEAWMYTTGSDLQGVLVARASGQPLDKFFEERIFAPLGMGDTGFAVPAAKLHRLTTSYVPRDGQLVLFDDAAQSRYAKLPKFPEGDFGLVSSVDDLLAFSDMMLGGGARGGKQLLSDASVKAMTRNHLTAAEAKGGGSLILREGHGWGYGMSVLLPGASDGLQPGAFGWCGGFGTSWFMDPAKGLTTILLTNRVFDGPDPPAPHKAFWKNAYAALA